MKERKEKDRIWEGGTRRGDLGGRVFGSLRFSLGARRYLPWNGAAFHLWMPPSLVFSQAQRFTGHNLEQLLGLEFMVILGKCNHTNVEFHGPQQMFFFFFFFRGTL